MTKRYYFFEVSNCEMCGDPTDSHKIMGQRLNRSQGMRPGKKTGIAVTVKRCSKCALIYSSPQPVPFDIQDHYGVPPEDYWRPEYFNFDPKYFSMEIETAKELLPFRNGMKTLDVGAGIGKGMIAMQNAGFDVYGFEPSKPFYERALSKMHIDPARLKLGMIEDMNYEPASFDFITFGAVFEHLYHPARELEKALKWLKPVGLVHIEVPYSKHMVARAVNLFYRLTGNNFITNISPMHEPFHMYEFTRESFELLGKRIGFEIVHTQHYVCEIQFFPKFLHPLLRKYMEMTRTGMQITVWLRKTS